MDASMALKIEACQRAAQVLREFAKGEGSTAASREAAHLLDGIPVKTLGEDEGEIIRSARLALGECRYIETLGIKPPADAVECWEQVAKALDLMAS